MGAAVGFATGIDPDWLHGEHSHLDGTPNRSLSDPHSTFQPDTYIDDPYWRPAASSDIHVDDGVPNKAFYLLSEGGTHNNVSVSGIGIANAMRVFWRANLFYWTPTTSFTDAKEASITAANDLDPEGNWGTQTRKAWEAVKVGVPVSPTHFRSSWFIRPYLPMKVEVTDATIDGTNLTQMDEIGVFDDSVCVGMVIVNGPLSAYHPATIEAFTDDPFTTESDGFTPGHSMLFRLWKRDGSIEIPSSAITAKYASGKPLFASLDSAKVSLSAHSVTAVKENGQGSDEGTPKQPTLINSYPNPFNSTASLTYYLPHATTVELKIFTILGEELRTLTAGASVAGYTKVIWDGRDDDGIPVSTGVYLARFKAGGAAMTRKLLLAR
jgi:hypothetical protein